MADPLFDTDAENRDVDIVRAREEEDVAQLLSSKYGMGYADLSMAQIDADAIRMIPEEAARTAEAAAFARTAKLLSLAVHNPNNESLQKLREDITARGFTLKEFLVSQRSLDRAFGRYADLSPTMVSRAGIINVPLAVVKKLKDAGGTRAALTAELDATVSLNALDRVSQHRVL